MSEMFLIFKIGMIGIVVNTLENFLKKKGKANLQTSIKLGALLIFMGIMIGELSPLFHTFLETFHLF